VLLCAVCAGCAWIRPAQSGTPESTERERADLPTVYNPATGNYEPVEHPQELVDTVVFTEDTRTTPVTSIEDPARGKKAVYDLTFLMPFGAEGIIDVDEGVEPKLRRFLHYYGGVKMALAEMREDGLYFNTRVYDCGESASRLRSILRGIDPPDAMIGPYDLESLRGAAEYGSKNRVPVFSPWAPGIPMESDNAHFIQLNPGLDVHAAAIVGYVEQYLPGARVLLVARSEARERSRLELFQKARRLSEIPFEELIIADSTADLNLTSLEGLLEAETETVFILPLYSRSDEDFINAFMRKLHAEKGEAEVHVFGLPQWLSFSRLNQDYMENTSVHVSAVQFIDITDPDVRRFEERYFSEYGTVPEPAAYQGYTFVKFLGKSLHRYGRGFLEDISENEDEKLLFRIRPVYEDPRPERRNPVRFYQNEAIEILQFSDHAFRRPK
jgi:hypothetical protein